VSLAFITKENKPGKSNKLNLNLNTLVNISKENFKILSPSSNYYNETISIKLRHYSLIHSVVFPTRLLSKPQPCNELKTIGSLYVSGKLPTYLILH